MFSQFAPVIRHSVQTMCTMFSRKDFFRLFGGLLRMSTRKTNAEPRCLTSLDGHDGAINVQRNTSNWSTHIIWQTQILIKLVGHVLIRTDKEMHSYNTCDGVKSYLFH